MTRRPLDTSPEGWQVQRRALDCMGGEGRVRTAIELSEAVREIQLSGLLARNPTWTRADAVQWLLRTQSSGAPRVEPHGLDQSYMQNWIAALGLERAWERVERGRAKG
jgi:hypothetical protein